jgi:hypothetical protein
MGTAAYCNRIQRRSSPIAVSVSRQDIVARAAQSRTPSFRDRMQLCTYHKHKIKARESMDRGACMASASFGAPLPRFPITHARPSTRKGQNCPQNTTENSAQEWSHCRDASACFSFSASPSCGGPVGAGIAAAFDGLRSASYSAVPYFQ